MRCKATNYLTFGGTDPAVIPPCSREAEVTVTISYQDAALQIPSCGPCSALFLNVPKWAAQVTPLEVPA
jgi:hypothetical protein